MDLVGFIEVVMKWEGVKENMKGIELVRGMGGNNKYNIYICNFKRKKRCLKMKEK